MKILKTTEELLAANQELISRNEEKDRKLTELKIENEIFKKKEVKWQQLNEELVYNVNERTDQLTKSEKLFKAMVENTLDIISLTDKEGKVIYVSPGLEKLTGYSFDEIVGKNSWEVMHTDAITESKSVLEKLLQNPRVPISRTNRFKTKTGDYIYVEGSVTNLLDDENVQAIVSNYRDVSERKLAEVKLEASEKKYRYIFENNPLPMWIIDKGTLKFLNVNEAAVKHYGYSRNEFLSMTAIDIRPEDEKEKFITINRPVNEENQYKGTWKHIKKNGTIILVDIVASEIIFEGKPVRLTLINDITERKIAEEKIIKLNEELEQKVFERTIELQKSTALFTNLFNNNPGSILISRLKDAEILNVNDSFLSLFGFNDKAEIMGKTARELNLVAYPEQREELAKLLKENKIIKDFEIKSYTKQGKVFWISTSILIMEINDEPCLFSISIDISNRKKAEEELKVVNAELDSFTYSVSHDLRAPLRSIGGFTEILMNSYTSQLDYEAKRYLKIIVDNTNRMGTLIDDLLTFSRLGKQHLYKKELDMNSMVHNISNEAVNRQTMKNVEIHIDPLLKAYGDEAMMSQVIVNLVSNAIKYTGKKEKAVIEISSYKENDNIVYAVKDNGVGFDMEYYDKLFAVFQRLHSAREFAGTGVGLSIAERIITKHNGKIWAEGSVNKGATFYFSLPNSLN